MIIKTKNFYHSYVFIKFIKCRWKNILMNWTTIIDDKLNEHCEFNKTRNSLAVYMWIRQLQSSYRKRWWKLRQEYCFDAWHLFVFFRYLARSAMKFTDIILCASPDHQGKIIWIFFSADSRYIIFFIYRIVPSGK